MGDVLIQPDLDDLLRAVYLGPLEAHRWQSFLKKLRHVLGASYATLLLRPPSEHDPGFVLNAEVVSPEVYASYNHTYFALDPFVDLPSGEVVTLQEFMPAERLVDTSYYQQYLKPLNIFRMLGADLRQPGRYNARLRITRGADQAEFGEAEKALVRVLLPHLEIAIQLHAKIANTEIEKGVYADAIEHLSMGCVILDESARVMRLNQAAQLLLDARQGLRVADGRLQVGGRDENIAFRSIIDEVMDAHRRRAPAMVRAFRLARHDHASDIGLLIRPLPIVEAPDGEANPSVVIFISDPESRREAPVAVLGQLFGFTPAESALALLLANGSSLDEAADELEITRNTAKSHLSAIFSKTGVTRQPKLVQLILKSVAPIS